MPQSAALRGHTHLTTVFSPSATLDALFRVSSCRWQKNRHREVTKPSSVHAFLFHEMTRGKKERKRQLFRYNKSCRNPPEFVWRLTVKCASKESEYSSERSSTERLKGRCFIPRGISYSLSLSADRSLIEISAHHTGCNKRGILL